MIFFLKIDSKGVINSTCNTIKVIKMSSSTSYDILLPCKLHWQSTFTSVEKMQLVTLSWSSNLKKLLHIQSNHCTFIAAKCTSFILGLFSANTLQLKIPERSLARNTFTPPCHPLNEFWEGLDPGCTPSSHSGALHCIACT